MIDREAEECFKMLNLIDWLPQMDHPLQDTILYAEEKETMNNY